MVESDWKSIITVAKLCFILYNKQCKTYNMKLVKETIILVEKG